MTRVRAESFPGLVIRNDGGRVTAGIEQLTDADLPDGDVTVDILYSSLNYKDGIAVTGRGVAERYPMVSGNDFVGRVREAPETGPWRPGDLVVANGWELGRTHPGGHTARQRVPGEWLLPLPAGLSPRQAAALGTAGLTAMLSLMALERNGLHPETAEPVLVTGASGGVGSTAVALLAAVGYRVAASTGRPASHDFLRELGAVVMVDRAEFETLGGPLRRRRWAGAIDTVGGLTLAAVLAEIIWGGSVAATGLVGGIEFTTTVLPFTMRNVNLLGINSGACPNDVRQEAWHRLAEHFDLELLERLATTVSLEDVLDRAPAIVDGQITGRLVVQM